MGICFIFKAQMEWEVVWSGLVWSSLVWSSLVLSSRLYSTPRETIKIILVEHCRCHCSPTTGSRRRNISDSASLTIKVVPTFFNLLCA